jgi:hypothetical protein
MPAAPKASLAATPLDPDVTDKLGKMFLMMSSPNHGEILAAVHAFNRTLEANGIDHHILVARMRRSWLTDGDKEFFKAELAKAQARGRAEGMMEAEARRYGVDNFRNADGSFDWRVIALYLQHEKSRLSPNTYEFVDKMAVQVPFNREPTPKQSTYLQSLFLQLGGRIA